MEQILSFGVDRTEKEVKNENDKIASSESVSIHFIIPNCSRTSLAQTGLGL